MIQSDHSVQTSDIQNVLKVRQSSNVRLSSQMNERQRGPYRVQKIGVVPLTDILQRLNVEAELIDMITDEVSAFLERQHAAKVRGTK